MAEPGQNGVADDDSSKPSVLIIGGLGYVGRFLAKYIHTHSLASTLRLVDTKIPQLANLAPEFLPVCSTASGTFLQADASRATSMARIFAHPAGTDKAWDYVFNLAGETSWGQSAEIYALRTTQLSVALGTEAAKRGVRAFVECSTGMVYASDRKPRVEADKLKPWLKLAKAKLDAELELAKILGLNLVVLRLAHVYGDYDSGFVAKALCLARVYQAQQRELKWLWTEDLRINTVHVEDVARALWTAAEWRKENASIASSGAGGPPKTSRRSTLAGLKREKLEDGALVSGNGGGRAVPTFNIVDHGDTSQGTLAKIVSSVFGIKTGFQGSLISQFAKMNLEHVVDDLNDEILQPWADLLKEKGVERPGPLSPFLEKELLKDTDLSLDGGLFEKETGFKYGSESLGEEGVRRMLASYERMGWWPS